MRPTISKRESDPAAIQFVLDALGVSDNAPDVADPVYFLFRLPKESEFQYGF